MKTLIESKPRKISKVNLRALVGAIKRSQEAAREHASFQYQSRQRNKVLLRLHHLSTGSVPAHMSKYFPFIVSDFLARENGEWGANYHRHTVAAIPVFRQILQEVRGLGFKASLNISKSERNIKQISLIVEGVK